MGDRMSLGALRAKMKVAQDRALDDQRAAAAKRQVRKDEKAAQPKSEVPSFAEHEKDELTNGGRKRQPVVNSTTVMEWFREGLREAYGDKLTIPEGRGWWTVGQKKTALLLLDQYGPEKVRRTISHFCRTWEDRVDRSNGFLGGIPTINLLWKMKDEVFAEEDGVVTMRRGRRKDKRGKNTDEYRPQKKPMGIGWE